MKPARSNPPTRHDWETMRRRLAETLRATEAAQQFTPERAREVLAERARALALVPPQIPQAAEVLEVVRFALAHEHYAIEARHLREIRVLTDYTPIPGAPAFLVGVINLRGEILAVIDLRKFFNLGERGLSDLSRVLVLGEDRAEFGILADAAYEVTLLRTEEVHEPPASITGIGREYLRGVTQDALIVLDGAVLLRDSRLFIDQGEETGN